MDKNSTYSSDRLIYRGLTRSDAEVVVRWRSNPDNYRFFFSKKPITLEDHRRWFAGYLDDPSRYDFVIFDKDEMPVGTVGLSHIEGDSCEINYMIGETSARGKGYAKEAVQAMTDIALQELGVKTVYARVLANNPASMAVAEGCGFEDYEHVYVMEAPAE